MGEANRRGTFEQRKEDAVKRKALERVHEEIVRAARQRVDNSLIVKVKPIIHKPPNVINYELYHK